MPKKHNNKKLDNKIRNLNGFLVRQLEERWIEDVVADYKCMLPEIKNFRGIVKGLNLIQAKNLFKYIDAELKQSDNFKEKKAAWEQISELLDFNQLCGFTDQGRTINPTTLAALEGYSEVFNFLVHHEGLKTLLTDDFSEVEAVGKQLKSNPKKCILFYQDYDADDPDYCPSSGFCCRSTNVFPGYHQTERKEVLKQPEQKGVEKQLYAYSASASTTSAIEAKTTIRPSSLPKP